MIRRDVNASSGQHDRADYNSLRRTYSSKREKSDTAKTSQVTPIRNEDQGMPSDAYQA